MEVSRSGFYEWRNAPESATVRRRGILALIVQKSFDESDEAYGYRRVHADLVAWGVPAGPELVRSVMRELGLEPCQPRPWRFSLTVSPAGRAPPPRPGAPLCRPGIAGRMKEKFEDFWPANTAHIIQNPPWPSCVRSAGSLVLGGTATCRQLFPVQFSRYCGTLPTVRLGVLGRQRGPPSAGCRGQAEPGGLSR